MLRFAALIRSAITRRTPMILISSTPLRGARAAGRAVPPVLPLITASRSWAEMRPPGPEPLTVARSTPATCALRFVAGEAMTRAAGAEAAAEGAAACGFADGAAALAAATGADAGADAAAPFPAVSKAMSSEP